MPAPTTCPRCQSEKMLFPVTVCDVQNRLPLHLSVTEPKQHALHFPTSETQPVYAAVCGVCGYTEFYATEPERLARLWEKGYR